MCACACQQSGRVVGLAAARLTLTPECPLPQCHITLGQGSTPQNHTGSCVHTPAGFVRSMLRAPATHAGGGSHAGHLPLRLLRVLGHARTPWVDGAQDIYKDPQTSNDSKHRLWALLTASILAPAMVIAYFAFGTVVLLRKTVAETGFTYAFGLFHMSTIWMAALVLQSALNLHASRNQMKYWKRSDEQYSWNSNDTAVVWSTFIFGHVVAPPHAAHHVVPMQFSMSDADYSCPFPPLPPPCRMASRPAGLPAHCWPLVSCAMGSR